MNKLPLIVIALMCSAGWQGQTKKVSHANNTFRIYKYPNIQPDLHLLACEPVNSADEVHLPLFRDHFRENKLTPGSNSNKNMPFEHKKIKKYKACNMAPVQL